MPRAVGARVGFDALPRDVLAALERDLGGRVVEATTQIGGMSPGPAARVVLDSGERYFVKAVGTAINAFTPRLHRRELVVLRQLADVPYRPSLVTSYDDGDWIALVLTDVDGAHPDLDDPAVVAAVREVVRLQTAELTPGRIRTDEPDLAATAGRWSKAIHASHPDVRRVLPPWWHQDQDRLLARVAALPAMLPTESFCHLDVRDDNLLVRRDGTVAVVDWGMSRAGPTWVDEVLLDLHVVASQDFDTRVSELPSYAGSTQSPAERESAVTDLLLVLGTSLALLAEDPPKGAPPGLRSFRRRESEGLLAGAARRLGVV